MTDNDDLLPLEKRCDDCIHWSRCRPLVGSNPESGRCFWTPIKFFNKKGKKQHE